MSDVHAEAMSDLQKSIAIKNIVSECEEMRRMADRIQQKLACFGTVTNVDLEKLNNTFKYIIKEFGDGGKQFCITTLKKYNAPNLKGADVKNYQDIYVDCLGFLGANDIPF